MVTACMGVTTSNPAVFDIEVFGVDIGILYLSGEYGSEMMYACLTLLLTDVLSLRPYSIKELGMTSLNEGGVQC